MNGSLAMSSIRLESDLILRSGTENPVAICDFVKQHCVFSLQYSVSTSGSTLNAFLLPEYRDFLMISLYLMLHEVVHS